MIEVIKSALRFCFTYGPPLFGLLLVYSALVYQYGGVMGTLFFLGSCILFVGGFSAYNGISFLFTTVKAWVYDEELPRWRGWLAT